MTLTTSYTPLTCLQMIGKKVQDAQQTKTKRVMTKEGTTSAQHATTRILLILVPPLLMLLCLDVSYTHSSKDRQELSAAACFQFYVCGEYKVRV